MTCKANGERPRRVLIGRDNDKASCTLIKGCCVGRSDLAFGIVDGINISDFEVYVL